MFDVHYRPLHLAAKWDHFEAAEILITAKAEVNAANHNNQTPMEIAFLNRRWKVARVLKKAGGEASDEFVKELKPDDREDYNRFGIQ